MQRAGRNETHDLFALPITGERQPRVVLQTAHNEAFAALSADGRWLAYQSSVTGQEEVWVRPYPGPGAPIRVSPNGGLYPVWGPADREIFYLESRQIRWPARSRMMAVAIQTEPEFAVEPPTLLFDGRGYKLLDYLYDVAPDGRFVMIKSGPAHAADALPASNRFVVVLNWLDDLQRLIPTP